MLKTKRLANVITLLAILLMGSTPFAPDVQGEIIDGDALETGDVVAVGQKTESGQCEFEDLTIKTDSLGNGITKWMGLEVQADCSFVVTAKWVGELEDGPSFVTDPLIKLLDTQTKAVEETTSPESNAEGDNQNLVMACKTSYQHVYMYGLAGPLDKLTHKYGTLTFCYNGSTATISSHSGTCQGSNIIAWSWVVDSCATTSVVSGPASAVSRTGRGEYHCSPPAQLPCNTSNPDGYYHNLRETEIGRANGSSTCTYGWGGVIVTGVGRQILQGCN